MTKRTLTLKRDRLAELTDTELGDVAGGVTGTAPICLCATRFPRCIWWTYDVCVDEQE